MSLLEMQSKPETLSDVVVFSFQTHMHLYELWLAITEVANILTMSIFYDKMKMYENESNLK